jgi:CHASE2 domain-containing sensor protein
MESTVHRPAVDVSPDRPRPGLALVLALLSVPGSTMAWELPLGGLWIGLPLGIAAIAVGVRARRELHGRPGVRTAAAAIVIAGLAIASMAAFMVGALVS